VYSNNHCTEDDVKGAMFLSISPAHAKNNMFVICDASLQA